MKKYLFENSKRLMFTTIMGTYLFAQIPLKTEAIPLTVQPFCVEFEEVESLGYITVKGKKNKSYTVPYAKRFTGCGTTQNEAAYYSKAGMNIFYRRTYAKDNTNDLEYLISYQYFPESKYRQENKTYNWKQMFEPEDDQFTNWRKGRVVMNSMYCGIREKAAGKYKAIPWTCEAGRYDQGKEDGGQVYETMAMNGTKWEGSGSKGEARYFGYSDKGLALSNTYFPNDYPWAATPRSGWKYDNDVSKAGNPHVQVTSWDEAKPNTTAYQLKYAAVEALKNKEQLSGSVESWMKKLSLQNNPLTEAPVFKASGWGGTRYTVFAVMPEKEADRNLGIESMAIYAEDNKTEIAKITRTPGTSAYSVEHHPTKKVTAGETYRVKVVIRNTAQVESIATKHSINVRNNLDKKDAWQTKTAEKTGVITAKGSTTIEFDYEIPKNAVGELKIEAKLNESYKLSGDNTFMDDDQASLQVKVDIAPKGDLSITKVYLVDAKKSTADKLHYVDAPVQGVDYFFVYEVTYQGDDMRGAKFNIGIDSIINTYRPQTNGTVSNYQSKDLINKKYPSKTVTLIKSDAKNPQKIYIKGNTFTATTSKIDVEADLVLGDFKWDFNQKEDNDVMSDSFSEPINLALSKVRVDPTTHPGNDYCEPFKVSYHVDFMWKYRPGKDREVQTVQVEILMKRPGRKDYQVIKTEKVKVYANQLNQHYITRVTNVCVPEGSSIKVKINANFALHEERISDNEKTYTWKALGNRKDYCYQANNKNTENLWTQRYVVLERQTGGYSNIVDILTKTPNPVDISNKESYEITAVWMRSKLMKDKGYGRAHPEGQGSGWVNALNPAKNEEVVIKAGYAFEFQIEVTYQTNAYTNEKNHSKLTNLPANQDVYNRLDNLPLKDNLYLKTSDGKTISLNSSDIRFVKSETSDQKGILVMTYTLDSRLSPNGTNQEVSGLFINEKTKDGKYALDFYTEPVYGVPGKTTQDVLSKNPAEYRPLCDKEQITFEVRGSYRDDLNIDLIQ